jgi:hypothetical protein
MAGSDLIRTVREQTPDTRDVPKFGKTEYSAEAFGRIFGSASARPPSLFGRTSAEYSAVFGFLICVKFWCILSKIWSTILKWYSFLLSTFIQIEPVHSTSTKIYLFMFYHFLSLNIFWLLHCWFWFWHTGLRNLLNYNVANYSAEVRPNIRLRFGHGLQLFGFGRIVKSDIRYISTRYRSWRTGLFQTNRAQASLCWCLVI